MSEHTAKILFIELPIDSWNRLSRHYLPNPGTLAMATYMKARGYRVKIIDSYADGISWRMLPGMIKQEQPDIIGASSYTPDIYGRVLLARTVKQVNPSIVTVFGGSHMTLMPEETLRLSRGAIDYGICGEGEETFGELVKALASGKTKGQMHQVKGLAYVHEGRYTYTGRRALIRDLDSLPMPDYSLVPMHKYRNSYFPFSPREGFSCYFSRGCTSPCTFCSESILWEHVWRGRSAQAIVEEMAVLHRAYGKRAFLLGDDNFLFNRDRNIEFIERMSRSKLRVIFRVGARVDTLLRDKDLLKPLRNVGMISLQIGIENFNQEVIDGLHKSYHAPQIKELARHLQEADIPLAAAFLIVGNYEDSARSIIHFVKSAYGYGFGTIQISALAPWPGTGIYAEMKKKNLIEVWDYRRYDFKNVVARTRYLNLPRLQRIRQALFYLWWFNPLVFLRNFPDRYRRHLHFYTVFQVVLSMIRYHCIFRLRLWKLFRHNRLIDGIYKEHMHYIGRDSR